MRRKSGRGWMAPPSQLSSALRSARTSNARLRTFSATVAGVRRPHCRYAKQQHGSARTHASLCSLALARLSTFRKNRSKPRKTPLHRDPGRGIKRWRGVVVSACPQLPCERPLVDARAEPVACPSGPAREGYGEVVAVVAERATRVRLRACHGQLRATSRGSGCAAAPRRPRAEPRGARADPRGQRGTRPRP